MKDQHGRTIEYLRLSITDLCNLRCKYCMPQEGVEKLRHEEILTFEQMLNVAKAAKSLGINKIRITGGEPLVKRNFISFLKSIVMLDFDDIGITTNGTRLLEYAKEIKEIGIKRVNVSIDSLDRNTYEKITGLDMLEQALAGLDAALEANLDVKINTVLLKDLNDNEIEPLINFAKEKSVILRFIELMPTECSKDFTARHYLSSKDVIKKINAEFVKTEGVANMYKAFNTIVGFISPISNKFCASCNKIRITSTGLLIPCLHSNDAYSLKEYADDINLLSQKITEYIAKKPISHFIGIDRNIFKTMNTIGG